MQPVHLGKYIPPDAQAILEFSCGDGALSRRCRMVNPACRYWRVTNETDSIKTLRENAAEVFLRREPFADLNEIGIGSQAVDCMVYTNHAGVFLKDGEFCKKHFEALKNGGQVICYLENGKYLKRLWSEYKSIEGQLTVERCKLFFQRAGVDVYEVIPFFEEGLKNLWEEKDREFLSLLERLGEAFHEEAPDPLQVLAKGFIIRAVKGLNVSKLSIQTFLGEKKVCARPRIYEPHVYCQTEPGVESEYFDEKAPICSSEKQVNRVFIWQRKWLPIAEMRKAVQTLTAFRYLIIAECDDDPFFRLNQEEAEMRRFSLAACHGIQVSTPALADLLGQIHPEVAVFENHLFFLPSRRVFEEKAKVTVFFGALNREADWRPLMPHLNRVLQRYKGRVAFKVIYDKEFFTSLELEDKEFFPFSTYETYIRILRQSDFALLPLGDTRMNRMKSDLKFLECAGNGVCVLASPVVYARTIENGKTGLIYNTEQEFETGVAALIENAALRERLREAAYLYVKENRLLSQHYRERLDWYRKLLQKLPGLNAELIKRVDALEGLAALT